MSAPTSEGKIPFKVGSETYETFYKVFGDLKTSKRRPIVALHGGPGVGHHYMLTTQTLYHKAGIPVIVYDQIGCGASSHRPDAPTSFWTPELFTAELDNLLHALDIRGDFDLIGQSWGGMLAAQYALTYCFPAADSAPTGPRPGLKRLIISNSPASIPLNTEGTEIILHSTPFSTPDFVRKVRALEAIPNGKGIQSEEYQSLAMEFYQKHLCTLGPWPKELQDSFGVMSADPTVYTSMWGPSEFTAVGTLREWSIVDELERIKVPTLLISGERDSIHEIAVRPYFQKIPKVKWVELQNTTHMGQFEDPERYYKVVLDFLDTA